MKDLQKFISLLEVAIQNKTDEFNKKILPKTRENYNIQATAVRAIKDILLKKRVIHDDPYKYDNKMSEIEIPSDDPFPDSEKAGVIGARLSHYEMMLDFLNNYYQFNTEFLTPKKISRLLKLNETFLWSNFTTTSNHPNTSGLLYIVQGIYSSPDKLSSSLLRDSFSHLSKTDTEIIKQLKDLSFLHKEEYKLTVRKNISDKINFTQEDAVNPSKILKEIKKICQSQNKKRPFYTDLVIEILKEDYGKNSDDYHSTVLKKLDTAENQEKKIIIKENYRHFLLSGFKFLGNAAPHFKDALEKIKANNELIYNKKLGAVQKLLDAIKTAFNVSSQEREITINIIDPITRIKSRQTVKYNIFESEMSKKAVLFANIATVNSQVQQKLKRLDDTTLLKNLTKHITESNELLKQMAGLDEFYKTVKPELRGKIRGIKIEITTITNSLIKANRARAEFTAGTEENEQMKKLGII